MNKQLYGITPDNLMRTLPVVLARDEGMHPLGWMIANALSTLLDKVEYAKIYARIDQLEESALDALAKDFDVVWYDYNYGLETKRALIKDSFFVHRHLGTKGALDRALSDIFPNSTVQEWFEYGGDPYYFRVVIDVTDAREPAQLGLLKKPIEYYKSYRSHLEEDNVIARISCGIAVAIDASGIGYTTPKSGTVPAVSTRGGIADIGLMAETDAEGVLYQTPRSGVEKSGTVPVISTQGGIDNSALMAGVSAAGRLYVVPKCGNALNALM